MKMVIEKEDRLIKIIEKKVRENLTLIEKITLEIMKMVIEKETLKMIDVQEKILITTIKKFR